MISLSKWANQSESHSSGRELLSLFPSQGHHADGPPWRDHRPSGCGKTTLMNLLPRFWDVDEGSITIDGHDVHNLRIRGFRKQIGIVPQETILFQATIAANIAYGDPAASRDRIIEAAQRPITAATKIRTNSDNRFRPATSNRGSRGIRDQPRNSPTHTEKRIRICPAFPCPSVCSVVTRW